MSRDAGLLLLNLLLLAGAGLLFHPFVSSDNLAAIVDDSGILVLLALGEAFVLLTRAVDLSVAANLALSGMVVALLNERFPDLGIGPLLVLAPVIGALLGAFNGALVWLAGIPSIVATLGTLAIYRGLVFVVSGGAWVNSNQMSPAFLGVVRLHAGLSLVAWLAVAGGLAAWLFLRRSVAGRNLFAVGSNPVAAAYAGIGVGRTQFVAFVLSGAIAGLCGYLWVARYAVAYTDVARGFELQAIAACVIGGVSIAGGVGSAAGVVLGALFLGIVKNALPLVGVSPFWQMAVSGLVITAAVLLNARGARAPGRRILEQGPAR